MLKDLDLTRLVVLKMFKDELMSYCLTSESYKTKAKTEKC